MGDRDWRPFIYGGIASCVAEFGELIKLLKKRGPQFLLIGTFPIDTTKTRLQIQGQKLDKKHAKLKYSGMIDCFFKTANQEGFASLYSG